MLVLFRAVAVVATASTLARSTPPRAFAEPLFSFHSSFWVNLHHFLYVSARAREGLDPKRPGVTGALGDTAGFGALPAADREVWERAVAWYDSSMAKRDILFDSGMVVINNALVRADTSATLTSSGLDAKLAAVLESAAPVYRRLWWPRHDAANRAFASEMQKMLAAHGDSIAAWESRLFRAPWETVRVDLSAYTNFTGAYTTVDPSHMTFATTSPNNQGEQGLEILFHEVLHTMSEPLLNALRAELRAQHVQPTPDMLHPLIFYTAGELTKREIPTHVPYGEKYGLWSRSPAFAKARPALESAWKPYLAGEIGFDEAVRRYVAALASGG